MEDVKIHNCNTNNSIFDGNDYVKYEDYKKLKDRCEQLEKHKTKAIHIITKERQLIKDILDSYWNTLSDGDDPSTANFEKWSLIAEKFGSHFGQEV